MYTRERRSPGSPGGTCEMQVRSWVIEQGQGNIGEMGTLRKGLSVLENRKAFTASNSIS